MKRFKNILLVHSEQVGSDDALSRATELAKSNSARLTIVDVVADANATPRGLSERSKRLTRLRASVKAEGVEAEQVVSTGTPFLQIIRQVLSERHDLVIMAADGAGDFRKLIFGSTSMHLMRKCPCPVWVLKSQQPRDKRKILAALALPDTGTREDDLNVTILDFATSLARTENAELHVLHAWDFSGADADTIRSEITDEIRDRLFRTNESTHRTWLGTLLTHYELGDIDCHEQLVQGRAEYVLPKFVVEHNIDLIVMGTLRRTGIPGFLIGSTAEYVLSQVDCSVLTMKPMGFQTPVTLG